AAKALDIAGIDIYHPTQDQLTGTEISFGGDMARSMKGGKNYLVIETEAQGFPEWTPYPGQLRLQAFSHLASGANMVEYWHWHSIHNSVETYWKGLLSQDFAPNPTYDEAKTIGKDFDKIGSHLVNLKKNNKVGIVFSNEALTAFNAFGFGWYAQTKYNDIVRSIYDALYRINIGCDFVDASHSNNFEDYKLLIVPALYAAPDSLLQRLNRYVKNGGHIVYTYKSGFSDENVKVRTTTQPGIINEACGISYSQFTIPQSVSLKDDPYKVGADNKVINWMEFVTPATAKVLAYYDHPVWGKYAAVTENNFGKGLATYIACMTSNTLTEKIMEDVVKKAGLWNVDQQIKFPLITKSGTNQNNKTVHYYFNYSATAATFNYPYNDSRELLGNEMINKNAAIKIEPWGVKIIEEVK
ncbi:MAG TPA: beta-galactosidase trimerization domain-containing protein, partial [Panacibacter sp.]|nr:beta-galactosidase trimerization domain-containing protein [Panacibacter sp.]